MNSNSHTTLIAGAMFLAGVSLMFLIGESKGQGPLDPPAAPAPSMKSLQQLSDQIAELEEYRESSGQNILVIRGSTAEVLTPSNPSWISQPIIGTPTFVAESEGSFCVVADRRVYGFSATTGQWLPVYTAPATVEHVASSKGGIMAFATNNQAFGFRPQSGTFVESGSGGTVSVLQGSD